MAKFYDALDEKLIQFINKQKMFFTATAPNEGRINLSPKGMDTFRCLSNQQVGFLNLTGSGNETAAHLQENQRLTIMFCSFEKTPLILRLYGTGEAVYPVDESWPEYASHFELYPGTRQIILMNIESVQTSCGYAVPLYEFQEERLTLRRWAEQKGEDKIQDHWQKKNLVSIDGLPTGLPIAPE